MHNEPAIVCPSCKTEIKLTESLAAPLLEATKQQYEERLQQQKKAIGLRELALQSQQDALQREREALEDQVQERMSLERKAIEAKAAEKAKQLLGAELDQKDKEYVELQGVLRERETKLAQAQEAQAKLIVKERELEDARREMNLTIQRQVQESLEAIRLQARKEAEEGLQLKIMEREQTIEAMLHKMKELEQKLEQGSQQLQGEVLEIQLETLLKARFPHDTIVPVPKGEFGGDILQRVFSPFGQCCGSILWESKRTKNWSDGWLAKLRDDQRAAKADCAIIVTQVLPRNVEHFDFIDNIWVTSTRTALPVAMILRHSLQELAVMRQAGEGQQTKMEMVYHYMTGAGFRQRMQAIVEKFGLLLDDLQAERKYMTQKWAKRDKQIQGAIEAAIGLRGDLEGIAGQSSQALEGFETRLLEGES